MAASGWGTISILSVVLACGCGGRAAQGSMQSTSGGVAATDTAGESAGASSDPPFSWDAGSIPYCSGTSPAACKFVAEDLPDLPPEQRWGALAHWSEIPCVGRASCGEGMFAVDHAGCVTAATDNVQSDFSACVLKYAEQFSWPCAADQRVRDSVSCTIK